MAPHRNDKSIGEAPPEPAAVPGRAPGRAGGATRAEPPGAAGGADRRRFGSRAPAFVRRSRALHTTWRIGVAVVGTGVIVAGILLLPLPGPGWAIIFAGLAILASEFAWAQRLMRWTKAKLTEYARRAVDPSVRRRNLAILGVVLVLIAIGVVLYVRSRGWSLPW
ncbi:TIGR02611 family protein [Peterkaempfera sp. SMS 1(5)a]|uniref:TIGR02611 family protein n=1 Tax=Peterkaempfera podocarpi TaxID=3232308 RepID=UPI003672232F